MMNMFDGYSSRPIFGPIGFWWRQILKLIDFGLSKFYAHPEVTWLQQILECKENVIRFKSIAMWLREETAWCLAPKIKLVPSNSWS
jgi:hypothetical protein